MSDLHEKTACQLAEGLRKKEFSSLELTQHLLKRIEQYDKQLNSFITVTADTAIEQAKAADKHLELQRKQKTESTKTPLSLAGIPIAQKDIFCTDGIKTSCGSLMLDNFYPPYNATVVERFNHSHAVLLGKTNMDEFAMGSSNENSYYGPTVNPWDVTRVPGGSSGGSAAAVAARLAPAATGTDTGGSIRQPAALCGISGLKPTYGRVSRYGMIAFASSLDQGGPMAKSAEDIALLMQTMAGFDPKDSTCANQPVPDYMSLLNRPIKGLKIGLIESHLKNLSTDITTIIQSAASTFEKAGATIQTIDVPHSKLSIAAYYIIAPAECSSNLARFDGVLYGYRCKNPATLKDLYCRTRSEGFGKEVKRRMILGAFTLSSGFYDAYYGKAQKVRHLIANEYHKAFESVDIILGPTTPSTAFRLNENTEDPIKLYLSDIYTIPANLGGFPCLNIPAGFQDGLPVGMQLLGPHFSEGILLNVAHQFQQVTDWHQHQPDLSWQKKETS